MIYEGLTTLEKKDVPDEQIELVSGVISDYIAEDGLRDGDKSNDERLEKLMRYGEEFLLRHNQITDMASQDHRLYHGWTKERSAAFNDHTRAFGSLYVPLGHLTQAPNFIQAWAVCFLVDIGVRYATNMRAVSSEAELSKAELEEAHYLIRFGENMLLSFKEAYERQGG
jgi:hypothetical protein